MAERQPDSQTDRIVDAVVSQLEARRRGQLQTAGGYLGIWRELIAAVLLVVAGSYYAANLESRIGALDAALATAVREAAEHAAAERDHVVKLEAELASVRGALRDLELRLARSGGDQPELREQLAELSGRVQALELALRALQP